MSRIRPLCPQQPRRLQCRLLKRERVIRVRYRNPKGRPKGTKNLKTDLAEELAERVSINENGKQRKLSKQRLMLKSQVTKAIKGDTRAADLVVRIVAQTLGLDAEDQSVAPLAPDDAAILERYISDMTSPNQREQKERDHENE